MEIKYIYVNNLKLKLKILLLFVINAIQLIQNRKKNLKQVIIVRVMNLCLFVLIVKDMELTRRVQFLLIIVVMLFIKVIIMMKKLIPVTLNTVKDQFNKWKEMVV